MGLATIAASGTFEAMALRPLLPILVLAACTAAADPPSPAAATPYVDLTADIQSVLDSGAAAWNRGDLDGFVSTYAVEATTTFVSGGEVQHGFNWIRGNYAPGFGSAERDSLRFVGLETRELGAAHALATAHYVLFQADSVTDTGIFTLVLRRDADGWKMIHDHTSR